MIRLMNPDRRCPHGNLLWWNYGDGKPRHISELFGRPVMKICSEALANKDDYYQEVDANV